MRTLRWFAPILLAAWAATGCGKSSPSEPVFTITQADADDIVQQLALTSVATDWGSYLLSGQAPPPGAPASPSRMRPALPASWDTTITQGGLTATFTLTFFDSLLAPQASFDPESTYVVEEDSQVEGAIALLNFDSAFFHAGNLVFTGTRTKDDTLRISGVAQDTAFTHFTSSIRNVERWFHLEVVRTIDNVRTLKTSGSYPHAGTVRWIITATRLRSGSRADVEATLDAEATLTFNGTRTPVLTITGGWTYTVDLDTGVIGRL